jgi:hypothetical protein
MTEFAETAMRKMCRNPKCRLKLSAPVSNEREAFCYKGCYSSFYLNRCRVCEASEGCGQRQTAADLQKGEMPERFGGWASEAQSTKGEKEMTIKISLKKIDVMSDTADVHFDVDPSEGQMIPLTFTVKREASLDRTVHEAMISLRDFAEMLHNAAAEAVSDAGT